MTSRFIRCGAITGLLVASALMLTPVAEGQSESVPTPRLPNGKPDLSGFWGGGGGGGGPQPDAEGNLTVLNRSRGCHPGMKICTAPVNQSNDSTFAGRFDPNRPLRASHIPPTTLNK